MENRHKSNRKSKRNNKRKEHKRVSSIDLLDKRIIFLNDDIDDDTSKTIIETLLKLDTCNHKDITMYINSSGGVVSSGLAIIDVMNMIKSDVSTVCVGKCCSMASIILINGAKGKRFMLPNSEIMIHEVASGTFGKVTEMQDRLEHSKQLNQRLHKIIADKTNMTLSQVKKCTKNKDKWIQAKSALRLGFVDKVLQ